MAELEHDRTMCRPNGDGTMTVVIVRTVPMPTGPVHEPLCGAVLDNDTMDLVRRHAARFMYPHARKSRVDRSE